MKRITSITLLMVCSEMLLCVFLANWLLSQWRNEERNLRTDLKLKFNTATQRTTDSLLKAKVAPEPPARDMPHPRKFRLLTPANRVNDIGSEVATLHPRIVVHKDMWSNGRDSISMESRDTAMMNVLEGVEVMIGSLLPDSLLNTISMRDTGGVRRRFMQALAVDGLHVHFVWSSPKAIEKPAMILLRGEGLNRLFVAEVIGYYPALTRKILPQILFALTLVLVTSLGFGLALRSLKHERRLSRMKNSLVSNMSHELKTPVTTVKVALEALSEEAVLDNRATVREYVNMATQELQRLELLINGTLHNSLMESGKLPMQFAPTDLRLLTEGLVDTLRLRLLKTGAQVSLAFTGEDFTINADKLHLQGVLLNIIDNALKYSGDGVRIRIDGVATSDAIRFSISDTGPGIPAAYMKRVFEKFFRIPTGNLHFVKGYGLGLSYAAEVARLHSGSIRVSSDEGKGSTFILQLPKHAVV